MVVQAVKEEVRLVVIVKMVVVRMVAKRVLARVMVRVVLKMVVAKMVVFVTMVLKMQCSSGGGTLYQNYRFKKLKNKKSG